MKREDFKNMFDNTIKKEFGAGSKIDYTYAMSNNEVWSECINIKPENSNTVLCMEMGAVYDREKGISNNERVNDVIKNIRMICGYDEQTGTRPIFPYNVGDEISCRVVNYERNRNLLKEIPHTKFLDLAIIYYVDVRPDHSCGQSVLIRNNMLADPETDTGALYNTAIRYLNDKNEVIIRPLCSMLKELNAEDTGEEVSVLVITNSKRIFGAVSILKKGILEKISGIFNDDYYLLPSSVHEFLAMPCNKSDDPDKLKMLVYNINRTELDPKDILSDSVYYYNREGGSLSVL